MLGQSDKAVLYHVLQGLYEYVKLLRVDMTVALIRDVRVI
jgi:hypothetical protein